MQSSGGDTVFSVRTLKTIVGMPTGDSIASCLCNVPAGYGVFGSHAREAFSSQNIKSALSHIGDSADTRILSVL